MHMHPNEKSIYFSFLTFQTNIDFDKQGKKMFSGNWSEHLFPVSLYQFGKWDENLLIVKIKLSNLSTGGG